MSPPPAVAPATAFPQLQRTPVLRHPRKIRERGSEDNPCRRCSGWTRYSPGAALQEPRCTSHRDEREPSRKEDMKHCWCWHTQRSRRLYSCAVLAANPRRPRNRCCRLARPSRSSPRRGFRASRARPPFPAAEPSAPRCWAKGRTSLHTGPDPVWRGFSHACLPEPLLHGPERVSGSPALWRERPGGLGRRVRARVRQTRWSLPGRLTRQPLLTKSADLELAPLDQLFDVPVNLALGSSALMVNLAAARSLLRHPSTRGASWSVPLLVSVSVPAGSQLGRSPGMYLEPAAKRKRFETGP